jgi:hypothetical protein
MFIYHNIIAMKLFNEHDTVIYTDADGRLIDTVVVFDTDELTGLTRINHQNLVVQQEALQLHPVTIEKHHLPMNDAFSFELFKKLKEKFSETDAQHASRYLKVEKSYTDIFAKAS